MFAEYKAPKVDPIAWPGKVDHVQWRQMALKRLKKYHLDNIILGKESSPETFDDVVAVKLQPGGTIPTEEEALATYRDQALAWAQDAFEIKKATVDDFFYTSMGKSGIAELRLRSDDLMDAAKSFEIIDKASTTLLAEESTLLVSQFLNKNWKDKEQSWVDFRLEFMTELQRLENTTPPTHIDQTIQRGILLNVVRTHFPAYVPVFSTNHAMTIGQLMDAIEGLVKSDPKYASKYSSAHVSEDERKISNAMAFALSTIPHFSNPHIHGPAASKKGSNVKAASSNSSAASKDFKPHFCAICNKNITNEHPFKDCPLYEAYKAFGGYQKRKQWLAHISDKQSNKGNGRPISNPSGVSSSTSNSGSQGSSAVLSSGFSDDIADAHTITAVEPLPIKIEHDNSASFIKWPLRRDDFVSSKFYQDYLASGPADRYSDEPVCSSSIQDINLILTSDTTPISTASFDMADVDFILDSGAVAHVTGDVSILEFYTTDHSPIIVRSANGACARSVGVGYAHNYLFYYVPFLVVNILSVPLICTQENYRVSFIKNHALVEYYPRESAAVFSFDAATGTLVSHLNSTVAPITELQCVIKNKLYVATLSTKTFGRPPSAQVDTFYGESSDLLDIWHRKLGHVSKDSLHKLSRSGLVEGMPELPRPSGTLACPICALVKAHKAPHDPNSHAVASRMFEQISIDVLTFSSEDLYLVCVDIYSKYKIVLSIKDRSNMADNVKWILDTIDTLRMAHPTMNHGPVLYLKCDNEFSRNSAVVDLLRSRHITIRPTAADSSFQNGPVERANQTLMNMAKCMLIDSGLPSSCFSYAIKSATFVLNRSANKTRDGSVIPYTVLTGKKPDLSSIHAFGQLCVYKVPESQRSKMEPRGRYARFVGYTNQPNTFFVRDAVTHAVRHSRDITFIDPGAVSVKSWPAPSIPEDADNGNNDGLIFYPRPARSESSVSSQPPSKTAESTIPGSGTRFVEEEIERPPLPHMLPRTGLRSQARLARQDTDLREEKSDADLVLAHVITDALDEPAYISSTISNQAVPLSFDEALRSPKAEKWLEAVKIELQAMFDKSVFEYVPVVPDGKKLVKCKFVFRNKVSSDGSLIKEKARLVAKGFSQIYGVDFGDTYAPVAHMTTLRLVLFLIAVFKLSAISVDFISAYLNAPLDEEIYMELPQGLSELFGESKFPSHNSSGRKCGMRLLKSLYGLKQSGRNWNQTLVDLLSKIGFTPHPSDAALLYRRCGSTLSVVLTYVDDLIIAGPTVSEVTSIYNQLNAAYPCTNQGEVEWILGIKVSRDLSASTISLSQEKYITDLMDKYSVSAVRSVPTPWDNENISAEDCPRTADDVAFMSDKPYRSLIGSLLWLGVVTRPDIMVRLLRLAKFQSNPGPKHWLALLRVLDYVSSTRSLSLTLGGIGPAEIRLAAFSDSDYNKNDDCKSTSGYVTTLGGLGSLSWNSKYQPVTCLSSTEAEYLALGTAAQEVLHLRALVAPFHPCISPLPATTIWCDNSSTILLTKHEINHGRSKHINVRFHFLRDYIAIGEIIVDKIPSESNRADMFTKYQSTSLFLAHRSLNLGSSV